MPVTSSLRKGGSGHTSGEPFYRRFADGLLFFQAWYRNPREVGAILPSGSALARAITADVTGMSGQVLELGSGTGTFTRQLVRGGMTGESLTLVETNPRFARRLRLEFPEARVLELDACRLAKVLPDLHGKAVAVVCGIPLLNVAPHRQVAILRNAFRCLQADGALYLFSYGLRCPISCRLLDRLGLRARRIDSVWLNVPPAQVWKLNRRGERESV